MEAISGDIKPQNEGLTVQLWGPQGHTNGIKLRVLSVHSSPSELPVVLIQSLRWQRMAQDLEYRKQSPTDIHSYIRSG